MQQLVLGDCLEKMKDIPDKSVDLIICDLPYSTTSLRWDKLVNMTLLWKEYKRIRKNTTPILLFGQEPFSSYLRTSNLEEYKYDWYWQKERPTNIMQLKRRPGKVIETLSVFYKKQCYYDPQKIAYTGKLRTNKIKDGSLGKLIDSKMKEPVCYRDDRTRYPLQILQFKRDILTSNLHPTQKPLALLEYMIKTYSREGDLVLDNCAGSGTTGLAARNLNRHFILIEKEKEYYDIILERLK